MFSTRPNTLLRVVRTLELRQIRVRVDGAEEDRLVLVHACIREEQRRVFIRDSRRRPHEGMPLALKVVEERLPHFVGGPFTGVGCHGRESMRRYASVEIESALDPV